MQTLTDKCFCLLKFHLADMYGTSSIDWLFDPLLRSCIPFGECACLIESVEVMVNMIRAYDRLDKPFLSHSFFHNSCDLQLNHPVKAYFLLCGVGTVFWTLECIHTQLVCICTILLVHCSTIHSLLHPLVLVLMGLLIHTSWQTYELINVCPHYPLIGNSCCRLRMPRIIYSC